MTPFSPRRHLLAVGLCVFATTACTTISHAQSYTFTTFAVDHAKQTDPVAINASGTVIGNFEAQTKQTHGFSYTAGKITKIVPPNATATFLTGINKAGTIVGGFIDTNGVRHGFIDQAGTFTTIDGPSAIATELAGINDSGTILGTSIDANGNLTIFTYANGTFTALPVNAAYGPDAVAIDDAGDVAGFYNAAPQHEAAWRYSNGVVTQMRYPKGAFYSQAMGITRGGVVFGQLAYTNSDEAGFIYKPSGRVVVTQVPGSTDSFLIGGNKKGTFVGASWNSAHLATAFVLQNGGFSNLTIPGATESHGLGINDAGTVLGDYTDSTGTHGFVAVPSN
jgi:probable HAF family extracellular repeat protein